ncbi:beta strand repeat-containing protein, partial [Flavobacterium sp.]|uniref:beta strand repeat-containing protein n=1 Tax=Flavobacterium sp. TaxID=239 RepID=UPI0037C17562
AAITSAGNLAITGNGITLNGDITTSGTQTYTGAVSLATGDIELTGTSATFNSTVAGGANALTITGNAVFNGSLSNVTDLSVSGTTTINAASVATSGTQAYTGAVTVSTGTTVTANVLTTSSTIAAAANNLTLSVDTITLGGNVSGTGALAIIPKTLTRNMYLGSADNSASTALNLKTADIAYLVDGFSGITLGGSGYLGAISSQANLSFKDPTTFTSSGTFTLSHDLVAASSTNASFTVGGALTWNGGNITTGTGAIALTGNVTLGGSGARTLTTTSGGITIGGSSANTLTGSNVDLTINSGSSSTTFNSTVSGVGTLTLGSTGQTGAFYILNDLGANSIETGTTAFDIYFGASPNLLSSIKITVDNGYTAYLNGTTLGSGNDWGSAQTYTSLGSLVNGQNVLAIYGYDQGGIAALQALLTYSNGTYAGSDTNWKVTTSNPTGTSNWGTTAYNDSAWSNASVIGAYNSSPWGAVINNSQANWIWSSNADAHDQVWFRYTFSTNSSASTSNLTVGSNANFRNTGALTFNSSGTANIGGTLSAATQSSVQLMGTINAGGAVTIGAAATPVTLAGNTTISTATANSNAGANIAFNGTVNGAYALSLNAVGGAISFNKTVGTTTRLRGVSINDAQTGNVSFTDSLSLTGFTSGSGSYGLAVTGASNSITNAVTFGNTGSLTLGDAAADAFTFSAGFTATAPSAINLAGSFTSNGPTTIGASGSSIALTAATTINTSGGSNTTNRALTLAAPLSGDNIPLTLTSGTGVITTAAMGTSGHGLGALIFNGDEFNPTADIYGQSTLVIKPYTSGNTFVIGGSNNNTDNVLNLTEVELAYLKNGFTGMTFGSSTTGQITVAANMNISDPLVIDTNGSNISVGADMIASGNGTFTFNDPVVISGNVTMITADQAMSFSSNLNGTTAGAENLILNTGNADITFNGLVGNVVPLNVISLDSSGTITINQPVTSNSILTGTNGTTVIDTPTISTVGTQSFNNAVLIKRNTVFSTTNSNITFNGTINSFDSSSARTVGIDAGTATVAINGVVGGTNVLGATTISGGTFSTGASGSITMGANAISITTDSISLAGSISGSSTLTIAPKTATTTIGLGTTAAGTLHLTDTELGKLSNGFSSITFGSSSGTGKITAAEYTYVDNIKLVNAGTSSGGIEFIGAVSVGANNLTLNTTGTVTQSAAITAAGLELLGTGGTYTLTN